MSYQGGFVYYMNLVQSIVSNERKQSTRPVRSRENQRDELNMGAFTAYRASDE